MATAARLRYHHFEELKKDPNITSTTHVLVISPLVFFSLIFLCRTFGMGNRDSDKALLTIMKTLLGKIDFTAGKTSRMNFIVTGIHDRAKVSNVFSLSKPAPNEGPGSHWMCGIFNIRNQVFLVDGAENDFQIHNARIHHAVLVFLGNHANECYSKKAYFDPLPPKKRIFDKWQKNEVICIPMKIQVPDCSTLVQFCDIAFKHVNGIEHAAAKCFAVSASATVTPVDEIFVCTEEPMKFASATVTPVDETFVCTEEPMKSASVTVAPMDETPVDETFVCTEEPMNMKLAAIPVPYHSKKSSARFDRRRVWVINPTPAIIFLEGPGSLLKQNAVFHGGTEEAKIAVAKFCVTYNRTYVVTTTRKTYVRYGCNKKVNALNSIAIKTVSENGDCSLECCLSCPFEVILVPSYGEGEATVNDGGLPSIVPMKVKSSVLVHYCETPSSGARSRCIAVSANELRDAIIDSVGTVSSNAELSNIIQQKLNIRPTTSAVYRAKIKALQAN